MVPVTSTQPSWWGWSAGATAVPTIICPAYIQGFTMTPSHRGVPPHHCTTTPSHNYTLTPPHHTTPPQHHTNPPPQEWGMTVRCASSGSTTGCPGSKNTPDNNSASQRPNSKSQRDTHDISYNWWPYVSKLQLSLRNTGRVSFLLARIFRNS